MFGKFITRAELPNLFRRISVNGGASNVSIVPGVNRVLNSSAGIGNVGAGSDFLYGLVISANSLKSLGDYLDITALISIVNGKTATITILFDGNTLITLGPSLAGANALIAIKIRAIRVSATDLFCHILVGDRGAMTAAIAINSWQGVSVTSFTSDFLFQIRGESTVGPANNDIVANWGIIELNQG